MKNRSTYALLMLFFAGLVGLWVADFAQVPTRKARERMSNRVLHELTETKPDDLRQVEILGGTEPIVFQRRDGNRWQMTSPMDVAADPSMVETLAYNLKELSRKPEAATLEGDPTRYGLAPPERTIRLWGTSTAEPLASLDVGKTSVNRRYVRATGSEGVEVVDARLLDLLKLPAERWRDHELFRVPSFEVDAVSISALGKSLKLRRGRDAWRVVEPIHALAIEARVDGMIADLGSLRVLDDTRFVANDVRGDALDRYGLKTPALTIEIDAGRGNRKREPQVLHVGKPVEGKEGQVYARRGDQDDVVAVDTRVLKDLSTDPRAFRSPKVADIQVARVARIEVERPGGDGFEVVRSGNDWTIVRPSPTRADRESIQNFLKSLDQLQTSSYPTPEAVPDPGLDDTALILKVWQARDPRDPIATASKDPRGDLAMSLRVGRRDAARKSIYARIEGDPTILALPESAGDFLPRDSLAFRDRQILAEASHQIERIKLVGPNRKVTLNAPIIKLDPFYNAPFGWWMVEPIDALADAPSVGRLLKLLSNLRAESLVAEKPDALDKHGLKSPALAVTWSYLPRSSMLRQGPGFDPSPGTVAYEDHTLLVGARVPGRPEVRYARLADRPLIFTLGQDVLGVLDSEWRDHRVLAFDPKHVRHVRLDWPDRSVSLASVPEGKDRKWSFAGPTDAPEFNPSQMTPFLQLASNLSTPRFVQYLGDFPGQWGLTPPRLSIRFDLDDGSPPRFLKLGIPAGPGQILATAEAESKGPVFLVPASQFAAWTRPPRRHDDLPEDVFAP
jgi:hypothetical protein